MSHTCLRLTSAFAALVLLPASAAAGGLFVPGTGPRAQGRAGAFAAKADDLSAVFHNPAGLAKLDGTTIQFGLNLVDYSLEYTRAGAYEDVPGESIPYAGQPYPKVKDQSSPEVGLGPFQAIPLLVISSDLGLDLPLQVAFGIIAPQAYPERNFTPDYQFEDPNVPPPPQRYDMMDQKAATILPSLAVAYRVTPQLDVGARFSAGIANLEASTYVWGIRNYEEWIARDGVFRVKASDNFVPAWGVGALFRPSPALELGLSVHSPIHVKAKGKGSSVLGSDLGLSVDQPEFIVPENDFPLCEAGGVDQDNLKACVELNLPLMATLGARWIMRDAQGGERADVELDVRYERWSTASDVKVIVDGKSGLTNLPLNEAFIRHGFQDVVSVRVGGHYVLSPGISARGGVAYDTAAAPEAFSRVDLDGAARVTLATGASYQLQGQWTFDVGGGFVYEPKRTVAQCNPSVTEEGCPEGTGQKPVADRTSPDPAQPLGGANNLTESPFNAGEYKSYYILLTMGVTYSF